MALKPLVSILLLLCFNLAHSARVKQSKTATNVHAAEQEVQAVVAVDHEPQSLVEQDIDIQRRGNVCCCKNSRCSAKAIARRADDIKAGKHPSYQHFKDDRSEMAAFAGKVDESAMRCCKYMKDKCEGFLHVFKGYRQKSNETFNDPKMNDKHWMCEGDGPYFANQKNKDFRFFRNILNQAVQKGEITGRIEYEQYPHSQCPVTIYSSNKLGSYLEEDKCKEACDRNSDCDAYMVHRIRHDRLMCYTVKNCDASSIDKDSIFTVWLKI